MEAGSKIQLGSAADRIVDFLGTEGTSDNLRWLKDIYWKLDKHAAKTIFNPEYQLFWLYLVAFIVVAALSFTLYYKRGAFRIRDFLKFCFPRAIYLHPSAIVDYELYIVNMALFPFLKLAPILGTVAVATAVGDQLFVALGPREQLLASALWVNIAFTVIALLVSDFAFYVSHAAHHFVPVLWPFHSVHHSAEVLTPITPYRQHPVNWVVDQSILSVTIGLFQGVLLYFFFGKTELIVILGVNFGLALFHFSGSNLRHSHIWLSYGQVLSHVLISPAQHQIHHSRSPEHRNKNMGHVFAIWDWVFGTLYVPKERMELDFGISDRPYQPHTSLFAAYVMPVIDCSEVVRLALGGEGRVARKSQAEGAAVPDELAHRSGAMQKMATRLPEAEEGTSSADPSSASSDSQTRHP